MVVTGLLVCVDASSTVPAVRLHNSSLHLSLLCLSAESSDHRTVSSTVLSVFLLFCFATQHNTVRRLSLSTITLYFSHSINSVLY